MMKILAILIAVVSLSGCATTYTYDGQKYDSKEKFQQGIDSKLSAALSPITPLPTPLTQKKLIFAVPSESTLMAENIRRFVALNGRELNAQENEMNENLSKSALKNLKVLFDAVQKRNIYKATQLIESQSMTGSFAASQDSDALYLVEPAQGASQWFYTSHKHGKQIFAFDRSDPTLEGKLQAFIDAVQAQVVRE